MITEDYVSFETAVLLKKKGFSEYCNKAYTPNGFFISNFTYNCIMAPTQSMAMKWLRQEYGIHIAVNLCCSVRPELYRPDYYVYVSDIKDGESLIKEVCPLVTGDTLTPRGFNSPEEAGEVAIRYCLERLVNPLKRRMSELKPEVLEVLYSLRLSEHKDVPYDEYINFFNFIVVDDVVYCTDDESTEKRVSTYFNAREGNEMYSFSLTALPDVVIKNGSVMKNRYGKML